MTQKDITIIDTQSEWYQALVDDCHAIMVEADFNSRWARLEGYHALGERIVTDSNLKWNARGNGRTLTDLSKLIGVGERDIYRSIQFYKKYPDINTIPDGKSASWTKVIKLLPEPIKNDPIMPAGQYRVIYADPPWQYNSGEQSKPIPYQTMSIEQLCSLPICDIAQDDSVLFLWVTSPLLAECFDVIKAWGFEYKTSIVWNKESHNVGYYVSVRHEFLLICTRGSCRPDTDKLLPSVVSEKKSDHSTKPETFRKMIDSMYPQGKRIELFSRHVVDGWDVWGNEL